MKTASSEPPRNVLPRHPFFWLAETRQRSVFWGAALMTMVLMAGLHLTNTPLQTPAAPMGMISLQLAGTLPAAQQILASWDSQAQRAAALNLGIDYPYMVAYATTLSLACVLLVRHLGSPRWLALLGIGLSWGMLVALILDAVENGLLIRLILGDLRESWAVLARWCAVPKFGLVLAALLYLVGGGLVCLVRDDGRHGAGH